MPTTEFPSLLAVRLLENTPLIETPEKDKWRIIAETVDEMHGRFHDTLLKKFTSPVFEMFERDLMTITSTIVNAPKKYDDHDKILELLRTCRRKASLAGSYYNSKAPIDRDAGYQAATDLETNLYYVLEYITQICKALDPKFKITNRK